MRVAVWIDTDSNDPRPGLSAIGSVPGADYYLDWHERLRPGVTLLRCRATQCRTLETRTLEASYSKGATFKIHAGELGETRRFRFAARAYTDIFGTTYAFDSLADAGRLRAGRGRRPGRTGCSTRERARGR